MPGNVAESWLLQPNPSGVPNSDVLRPIWNGQDVAHRWSGRWVIDLGTDPTEHEAARYEAPFRWIEEHVRPVRATARRKSRAARWWRLGETRPGLRAAVTGLGRVLITPETIKHRFFRWLSTEQAPDHALIVFATDEDWWMGVLSTRIHYAWVFATGNRLGVGNDLRYNSTRTFWTFPLPCPTPEQRAEIAEAASELDRLREAWLNPPDWTRVEELAFPATVGGPWHRWILDAGQVPTGTVAEARYRRVVP